jgi:hypothetical protein
MNFIKNCFSALGILASIFGIYLTLSGGTLEGIQDQISAWKAKAAARKIEAEVQKVEAENRRLVARQKQLLAEAQCKQIEVQCRIKEQEFMENEKSRRRSKERMDAVKDKITETILDKWF